MSFSLPLPSDLSDPVALTDWLELFALLSDDQNSSHGDLERVLNRLGNDSGAKNVEEVCLKCMQEIGARVNSSKEMYPFDFKNGSLIILKNSWDRFTPYVFCLLLSYCGEKQKRVSDIKHTIMFEQLSCIAARNYIGGAVLRFGAPRIDMPSGFKDALEKLSRETIEWNCSLIGDTLQQQDGGLDLVAWKEFPDKQIGKLILFGHCASGNNWEDKINELHPANFCTEWLGGEKSPVVKSFFIPHRIAPERWSHCAIRAKLFFDRCRIASWVRNDEFSAETRRKNIKWCATVLKKLRKNKK